MFTHTQTCTHTHAQELLSKFLGTIAGRLPLRSGLHRDAARNKFFKKIEAAIASGCVYVYLNLWVRSHAWSTNTLATTLSWMYTHKRTYLTATQTPLPTPSFTKYQQILVVGKSRAQSRKLDVPRCIACDLPLVDSRRRMKMIQEVCLRSSGQDVFWDRVRKLGINS